MWSTYELSSILCILYTSTDVNSLFFGHRSIICSLVTCRLSVSSTNLSMRMIVFVVHVRSFSLEFVNGEVETSVFSTFAPMLIYLCPTSSIPGALFFLLQESS
jgi:hypothetical protein